jgi:hypothetical protein
MFERLRSFFGGGRALAVAEKQPTLPAGGLPPGIRLRQFHKTSTYAGDGSEIVGVFNPIRVTLKQRKMMLKDPLIGFGIALHRSAITNLQYTVESRDEEIRAFIEAALQAIYPKLAMGGSMAIPLGWQVLAKQWAVQDFLVEVKRRLKGQISADDKVFPSAWIIEKTKAIPHETLRLLIDPEKDEWGGVEQGGVGNMVDGKKAVGPESCILWSHRAEDVAGLLTGWPLLDQAFEPWWFGVVHELSTNRYFERKGEPTTKGFAPAEIIGEDGKAINGWQWLADHVGASRNGSNIILDSKTDEKGNRLMDFEYVQDEGRGEMFVERAEKLEVRKLRALLITDRVMAAGAGGLGNADAEFQADVLSMFMDATVTDWLGSVVNPQVVEDLGRFNFPEDRWKQSRTRVVAGGLSNGMKGLLKDVMKIVLQADSMIADGRPTQLLERLDVEGIARSMNLPIRPADEIEQIEKARKEALDEERAAAADADPQLTDEGGQVARKTLEGRGAREREGHSKDE